jgi:EAL domain-containing protein (putative c-di-GMP-specific phosphodiesterase class I)
VPNLSSLYDSLKLVIQPLGEDAVLGLPEIGFQPVPTVPQLLYRLVTHHQLADIFSKISQLISESSQTSSRFIVTRSALESRALLVEFLTAQSLSGMTSLARNAWFLQVLAKQNLFFKYQPIFNLASQEIVAHECLARATSDQSNCFSGQQLIDAALEMNLTREFDDIARTRCLTALAELAPQSSAVMAQQKFFINLMPNAIAQNVRSLEHSFQQVVDLGLSPQQIVFELTETETITAPADLSHLISQMRTLGFGVALDDVGSNVAIDHYCTEVHPDIIKLDRRLIKGCSHHQVKQIIIKSLLQSTHEMGIMLVAEGLEDLADLAFCRDIGIDFGQGYCLAMPELTPRSLTTPAHPYLMSKAS